MNIGVNIACYLMFTPMYMKQFELKYIIKNKKQQAHCYIHIVISVQLIYYHNFVGSHVLIDIRCHGLNTILHLRVSLLVPSVKE